MAGITLGNIGAGNTIVGTPSSTTLATKGIIAGSNVTIYSSSTDLTINSSSPGSVAYTCIVNNSTSQSYSTGVTTNVTFDTELYDPSNMHSTSSNTERINILASGIYDIRCNLILPCPSGASSYAYLSIYWYDYSASTTYSIAEAVGIMVVASPTNYISLICTRIAKLDVNDYVYLGLTNSTGTSLSGTVVSLATPVFSVMQVSS